MNFEVCLKLVLIVKFPIANRYHN